MAALRNAKWEEACQHFVLEGTNKVTAYLHAFTTAHKMKRQVQYVRASELFAKPALVKRVAELVAMKADVADKTFGVNARYVLQRLVDVDQMDVIDILDDDGGVKPVKEWPKVWRQFICQFDVEELFAGRGDDKLQIGLLKKIKWPDKTKNLKLLGTHVDVNAFKEIKELQGPGGGPVRIITSDMTPQEAAEAYADTLHD